VQHARVGPDATIDGYATACAPLQELVHELGLDLVLVPAGRVRSIARRCAPLEIAPRGA
jgi:hypothetical protein